MSGSAWGAWASGRSSMQPNPQIDAAPIRHGERNEHSPRSFHRGAHYAPHTSQNLAARLPAHGGDVFFHARRTTKLPTVPAAAAAEAQPSSPRAGGQQQGFGLNCTPITRFAEDVSGRGSARSNHNPYFYSWNQNHGRTNPIAPSPRPVSGFAMGASQHQVTVATGPITTLGLRVSHRGEFGRKHAPLTRVVDRQLPPQTNTFAVQLRSNAACW